MPVTSTAVTTWKGSLFEGSGAVALASSRIGTFPVDWKARAEGSDSTTTPEELLAAAHASCFSMALSNALTEAGHAPASLEVTARVGFVAGKGITGSALSVVGDVSGISATDFQTIAESAKTGCPVSQALAGIPITLEASLA